MEGGIRDIRIKEPGSDSPGLLPPIRFVSAGEVTEEDTLPLTFLPAPVQDLITEAIATWFLRLAEEMEGGDPSDPPWRTDPGDLKWSDARRYVLTRDSRACAIRSCGGEEDLTVHHILPRAWGGTHHPGNLVTLCARCHRNLCDSCTRPVSSRVPPLYLPP